MAISSRGTLAVRLLVCFALYSVDGASYRADSPANILKREAENAGGAVDPVIAAQCTECAQLKGVSEDDLEGEVEECIVVSSIDPDYDCSSEIPDGDGSSTERELEGYLDERRWRPFKKLRAWFKKNKAKIIRALIRAARLLARILRKKKSGQ